MHYLDLTKLLLEHNCFVSVIENVPAPAELVITQVNYHVKMRLISTLINGISRVLQKSLKYFNDTSISTSFLLPSSGVFPVIFALNLNDALLPGELKMLPLLSKAGSSL